MVSEPTVAEKEWHRALVGWAGLAPPRPRIVHLVGVNLVAAGASSYARHLSSLPGSQPIGVRVVAPLTLMASLLASGLAGSIGLGRLSSALHRMAEGLSGGASLALRAASVFSEPGAFSLLGAVVVLVGLMFLGGVGSVAAIVIGVISAD